MWEVMALILISIVFFIVGAWIGYQQGEKYGIWKTYQDWARRIDAGDVASRYADDIELPRAEYKKPRLKFRRKHRKQFKDKYDRKAWFWNDIVKVKRPEKWTKKKNDKLVKELEAIIGGE